MTGLPRYREPMCGWPADLDVCGHDTPRDVCTDCFDEALATSTPATLNVGPPTLRPDLGDFRPSDAKYDDE